MPGERFGQRANALDLLLRCENPALELDRAEPVLVDHALGGPGEGLRRGDLAPGILFRAKVCAVFVEQVRRELDGVACLAAEQIDYRTAEVVALRVQAGDLDQ